MRVLLFLTLVCASLLTPGVAQTPDDPDNPNAGRDPKAPPLVAWQGDALHLIAGVNLGLRKIFLQVDGHPEGRARMDLALRVNDRENLQKDIFKSYLPPERLGFVGRFELETDGNRWTEYRFHNGRDVTLTACYPVHSLGPDLIKRLAASRFDFSEKHLPFALAIIDDGKNRLFYPLRDLVGFDEPKKALMEDLVPFEPSADLTSVAVYLAEKLNLATDDVLRLRCIERLDQLGSMPLRSPQAQGALLSLRDQGSSVVADLARRVCRRHGIWSDADVLEAVQRLLDKDDATARAACVRLRDMGAPAASRARGPLEEFLKRTDLSPETRSVAEAALQKMKQPVTLPTTRPVVPATQPSK